MIQDIAPHKFDNSYRKKTPEENDRMFFFDEQGSVFASADGGSVELPYVSDFQVKECVYLFSIDDTGYFLAADEEPDGPLKKMAAFSYHTIRELRDRTEGPGLFAAFTAYHLWKWYSENRYCGKCSGKLSHHDIERALVCKKCGKILYPRINPAVIVGVINGDSILITRYREGYRHNALIAGFAEIGETLEETVRREVMEEAGIKVKNIRYYRSQPWGMALDLLVGFFCEVDGDEAIRMDESELKYAAWTKRKEIELQPNNLSLTNEMMRLFKEGRI